MARTYRLELQAHDAMVLVDLMRRERGNMRNMSDSLRDQADHRTCSMSPEEARSIACKIDAGADRLLDLQRRLQAQAEEHAQRDAQCAAIQRAADRGAEDANHDDRSRRAGQAEQDRADDAQLSQDIYRRQMERGY